LWGSADPHYRCLRIITHLFFLVLLVSPDLQFSAASPLQTESVKYIFRVDAEGWAETCIIYHAYRNEGYMWILVPSFTPWINKTVKGKVKGWSIRGSYEIAGFDNPFYEALCFYYESENGEFELLISYNHSLAAMIVEPEGIFFSPQIGFKRGCRVEMEVIMPRKFTINSGEALALGSRGMYRPSLINRRENKLCFSNIPAEENLLRIEVSFKTEDHNVRSKLQLGIFDFEVPQRYAGYALHILNLYNHTYAYLVDLFNVTLTRVHVRFFLPDFNSLLEMGGYVPFSSGRIGDIYLNVMYLRAVRGEIEVIALHELIHHFLWRAGISPSLLWFHEGMAQYISLEICDRMKCGEIDFIRRRLRAEVKNVRERFADQFGFLQEWTPSFHPQDPESCYASSYYIVSVLAEEHGGIEYYRRFFRTIKDKIMEDDAELAYYLSLAAGESVVKALNGRWGFSIPDLYGYSQLLNEVRALIENVSGVFEPYKSIAKILFNAAVRNANREREDAMKLYLIFAALTAKLAPILTLITVIMIVYCLLILILKLEDVFSDRPFKCLRISSRFLMASDLTSS